MTQMEKSSLNPQWYVVKTKARQESQALEQLRRQQFCCFFPRLRVRRKRNGRYRHVVEALFKSYLFVQLDTSIQDCSPIRSTRGVQDLVRFGNQLIPVPPSIIRALQKRVDEDQVLAASTSQFKPGQKVSLELGSFAGLEAIFCEPKGEDRAILFINLLGRMQHIEVPVDIVA
jgi:transcriptional antiterminator RfaH